MLDYFDESTDTWSDQPGALVQRISSGNLFQYGKRILPVSEDS